MLFSAALLAIALVSGAPTSDTITPRAEPAKTCVAAERTGTFRITTQKEGTSSLGLGLIVLENIDGCLEATFITDNSGPANIDALAVSANTLKGALRLPTGQAKVTLEFVGTNVAGSIVQGRNAWAVSGRKTS